MERCHRVWRERRRHRRQHRPDGIGYKLGAAYRTGAHRRALHAFYCRWDKPQQQYQKKLLPTEVQNRLSPQQRLRLLDRPELIQALGDETVEDTRRDLEGART